MRLTQGRVGYRHTQLDATRETRPNHPIDLRQGDTPMAAKGADTLKATVDQFTTAGNQAFKDSIEKSLSTLGEVNVPSKKNLEAVVASVPAATKGAEALGAQAMAYSKKALEDQAAAAK